MGRAAILLLLSAVIPALAKPPTPALAPAAPAYQPPTYFFTADLDPHYQFVGTGALTEEQAAHSNCYRFIYNSSGKLQQVEYRRAGVLMPDPLFQIAQISMEYQDGIERRKFSDEHNQLVASVDGIYGEELAVNPSGYATEITNLNDTGAKTRDNSGVQRYVRTLDEHGRVVALQRYGLFGSAITDDGGFYETRTAYDEQGHVMERGNYDADGKPLNNADGVALVRKIYTFSPDTTVIVENYFDAGSLPVEEKSTGIHQRQRTYDKRGFLLDDAYFDATGAPTASADDGVHERRYLYDDKGNELSEEYFGIDGKPVNQKEPNYSKVVYKYDGKNRVIEKDFFGDDGTPQVVPSLGAAIVKQTYNKRGDLVRREFFDGQRHPSNYVQTGSPAIRIKVEGDTTTVSLRDADDQPMRNPIVGYYSFSYKTASDQPFGLATRYFDKRDRPMSRLRSTFINPHLHQLETSRVMKMSAHAGAACAGLGALLACFIALRKSSHTKRRKVYVPSPLERFLGWFAIFAIFEGSLRFFMTLYWTYISLENGRMGPAFHVLESIFICFFLYRLYRLSRTMRVLNIERDDMHRIVREFFAKTDQKPEWIASSNRYVTPPLDVRVNYFKQKYHAYLAFTSRGEKGSTMASDIAAYIRAQVGGILAPVRSKTIAFYYPSVALCYFLLAGMAFYTLYQMVKSY